MPDAYFVLGNEAQEMEGWAKHPYQWRKQSKNAMFLIQSQLELFEEDEDNQIK